MYARIKDGKLEFAPKLLSTKKGAVLTNSAAKYKKAGYLPIETTDGEGEYHWEQIDGKCKQVWNG